MYKNLIVLLLMLLFSTVLLFAQEAVDAGSFEISDEISEPLAFNFGSAGESSVYYPEVIPNGGMPQSDIVGKPVEYASDYYTQYQQRDSTSSILWTAVGVCVLACALYTLLYMVY